MFIRENLTSSLMDSIMKFVSFLGNGGLIWLAISLVFVFSKRTRKWSILIWISMIMGLFFGNLILKNLFARIRPYDLYNVPIIIAHPSDYSFPSGHTLSSFAAAIALYKCNKKYGTIALVFAAVMGFSRMYLFVHYPTDILGGIILAFVMVFFAERTIDFVEKKLKRI
ncbi:MAG: phosphatase PAP2 family protein [Clostridia bacterium]|nr:phosphatase PAP2 family protein [Clostridia bacterium]